MKHRHGHRFERILPAGEIFYLSYAGNHNRGAHFTNLYKEIDEDLVKVFDDLSHYTDKFYYGRYDIKTTSIEDLKQGKNFLILEFNGCGAEPNHIYDCSMSLWKAYGVILKHWKVLFSISRYNHRNGTPYWSLRKGWNCLRTANRHFKMLEKFDSNKSERHFKNQGYFWTSVFRLLTSFFVFSFYAPSAENFLLPVCWSVSSVHCRWAR